MDWGGSSSRTPSGESWLCLGEEDEADREIYALPLLCPCAGPLATGSCAACAPACATLPRLPPPHPHPRPCRVPAYYALILRSLTVLEGLALGADPEYRLLGKAYPYMARRLLTDPAPELRWAGRGGAGGGGGGAGSSGRPPGAFGGRQARLQLPACTLPWPGALQRACQCALSRQPAPRGASSHTPSLRQHSLHPA